MNDKYWKFLRSTETVNEKMPGREHEWYFNAAVTEQAGTYLVRIVMPEGGMHNFHRHPEMNEILYILEGTAEQWIEDEVQLLGPGDAVYIAEDVVHGTFNAGNGDLIFLAILAPSEGWAAGTIDESGTLPYANYRK